MLSNDTLNLVSHTVKGFFSCCTSNSRYRTGFVHMLELYYTSNEAAQEQEKSIERQANVCAVPTLKVDFSCQNCWVYKLKFSRTIGTQTIHCVNTIYIARGWVRGSYRCAFPNTSNHAIATSTMTAAVAALIIWPVVVRPYLVTRAVVVGALIITIIIRQRDIDTNDWLCCACCILSEHTSLQYKQYPLFSVWILYSSTSLITPKGICTHNSESH